jgi:hypothetical protein
VGDEGFYCIPGKPAGDFIENCSSGAITPASGVADWFGFNLPSPLNITGKSTIKVDMETQAAGTSTAIAIQTGAGFTGCQTANWGFQGSNSTAP